MSISSELKIGATLTFIFFAIIVIFSPNKNQQIELTTVTPITVTPSQKISPTPTKSSYTNSFSLKQVATHSSQNDCWLIINNKVYNATSYLFSHPGGVSAITPYCGANATAAYVGMQKHGGRASVDLSMLLIGNLQ